MKRSRKPKNLSKRQRREKRAADEVVRMLVPSQEERLQRAFEEAATKLREGFVRSFSPALQDFFSSLSSKRSPEDQER